MRATAIQRHAGTVLAALLPLLAAAPAPAEEPVATHFELALTSALAAPEPGFVLSPEPDLVDQKPAPELPISELRAGAWALDERRADSAAAAPQEKRGFGRWLKKRWWVPVLAGAALAVALDDGDDDRSGEED